MIEWTLDRNDGSYLPGEMLRARMRWQLEMSPRKIYLEVRWDTQGKGTSDHDVIAAETWTELSPSGDRVWSVMLPRGPFSLKGQLLQITWSIHCNVDGRELRPLEFTLSPSRLPIRLARVEA